MKTLIFLITIIAATSLVRAGENEEMPVLSEAEVIWETEQIGGLNEVEVSPLGEHFYNTKDSIVQVRSVETGELIEEILFPNTNRLDAISISADGRLMAVSGEPKYIFIYDLVEKREVKQLTTTLLEREENGKIKKYLTKEWHNSSISPDGTKVAGIAEGNQPTGTTSWVVFDIETGEEIVKETKIRYDYLNPDKSGAGRWISTEFTPDGSYIVSQSTWSQNGEFGPDSIYIHDANTLEIYDVVLNKYNSTYFEIVFSNFEPIFCTTHYNSIFLYNLTEKSVDTIQFDKTPQDIIFSELDNNLLVRVGVDYPAIFDYKNNILKRPIEYIGLPKETTKDNRVIYRGPQRYLALLKVDWNPITNIKNRNNKNSNISPNPSTGNLIIELNNRNSSNFNYELISISGQIVKSNSLGFLNINNQNININISDVTNGQYTLRVFSEQEEFMFNIIKEG